MKVFYIDSFSGINSNFYWLKYFKRNVGKENVKNQHIKDTKDLHRNLIQFSPNHVHLGGSVKNFTVPIEWLKELKQKFNTKITAFHGDPKFSVYHRELSKVIDKVYCSNQTFVDKINNEARMSNCEFLACPTDPEIFKPLNIEKIYDVLFIGNKYRDDRSEVLGKVKNKFQLKLFGRGWGSDVIQIYGEDFVKACNQAKIVLGIVAYPECYNLKLYFSNRLINTLACGSFYISPYTQNLEEIFTKEKHLVWYKNIKELFDLIEFYLEKDDLREKIARQGKEYILSKFTYDKSVERILKG